MVKAKTRMLIKKKGYILTNNIFELIEGMRSLRFGDGLYGPNGSLKIQKDV